ncbi:MAG: winged helix-turn-helix domain-containing protein [Eubacterium sp.]|nr:winged helix-turn-helix domain-containing protein [Eubacterium sp.]
MLNKYDETEIKVISDDPVISISRLEIHTKSRKTYCNKKEITLTAKEYSLLHYLAANKDITLTYDQIYNHVWGNNVYGNVNNNIACYVSRLRKKLCGVFADGRVEIKCENNFGYTLTTKE